jgi:hypothetical protein
LLSSAKDELRQSSPAIGALSHPTRSRHRRQAALCRISTAPAQQTRVLYRPSSGPRGHSRSTLHAHQSRITKPKPMAKTQSRRGTRTPDPFITSVPRCPAIGSPEPYFGPGDALRAPQIFGVRDMVRDTLANKTRRPTQDIASTYASHAQGTRDPSGGGPRSPTSRRGLGDRSRWSAVISASMDLSLCCDCVKGWARAGSRSPGSCA